MKVIYKIGVSIFSAIVFFSFFSLLSKKIYEKPAESSVYSAEQNGYAKIYSLLENQGYNLKVEAVDSNNIGYFGSGALWIIFPAEEKYSQEEIGRIKNFVNRGGNVFIADRFGSGKDIARNFDIAVFGRVLVEYDSYAKRQDLPILPATIDNNKIYFLAFKFPSAISNYPPESEIISKSSRVSFIDFDGDGKITVKDQAGPFPVAIKTRRKEGYLTYFSDSSAFTNDLAGRKDNEEFFKDYVASLKPNIIVFDESHNQNMALTKNTKFFVFIFDLIKDYKTYVILFVFIIALLLADYFLLRPRKKKKDQKHGARPTEYSNIAKRILANYGNNAYTRRWVVFMAYSKIKKNILAKTMASEKNITRNFLLEASGLAGKEKSGLASLIDLGLLLERGDKKDISYAYMEKIIKEAGRIDDIL